MDIKKVLANNLRKLRGAAGISQERLAWCCGVHRTYIGGIEEERINVSINNLSKIAYAFGVPTALLLSKTDGLDVKRLVGSKRFPKIGEPIESASPDFKNDKQQQISQSVYATCIISGNDVEFCTLSETQYENALTQNGEEQI